MEATLHQKCTWLRQHRAKILLQRAKQKNRIYQLSRANESERFLLCRPKGGLNDCLFQIYETLMHAIRSNRRLIIDTKNWGLCDEFSNYFETILPFSNIKTALTTQMGERLNKESCYPHSFKGKLDSYKLDFSKQISNFVNRESAERPCIISPDPPETVLLHDQCGGGLAYLALPYFKLTPDAASSITTKLATLPKNYKAIHLRSSDAHLDVKRFLYQAKPLLQGSEVLVCTDSQAAFKDSVVILNNSTIHQISPVPNTKKGQRLHDNPIHTNRDTNLHSIADIIGLANAKEIIFPSGPDIFRSGFTELATELSSRDYLLRQLLGKENWRRIKGSH